MSKITAKQLVFSAMALALATVIATTIKLPSLPFGGSISLFSMLVICLVGFWYGPKIGLITSFTYGILQFITGPYVVHPLQILLDFPLAFGALGLSGFFYEKKHGLVKGYLCGVTGRLIFHSICGAIFYTTYVDALSDNLAALWAGIVYNMSYIVPEAVLTLILLSLPPVQKMMVNLKKMAV